MGQRHTPYVSPSRPPVAFQRHTPYVSPSRPPSGIPAAHTVRVSITSSKWYSSGTHRTCLHHVLQVAFQRHTPYVSPSRPPVACPPVAFQRHAPTLLCGTNNNNNNNK